MISHEFRCIFIHINRTGGKSIEKAVWDICPEFGSSEHKKISSWQRLLTEDEFNSYFKFTFCRNPWDRLVSLYSYYKETLDFHRGRHLPEEVVDSFKSFCLYIQDDEILAPTQLSWILDLDEKPNIDFIGRFERFDSDWEVVCKKIEMQNDTEDEDNYELLIKLPHLNKSNHRDYKEYYDKQLIDIVRKKYKEDISFFGYEDSP